MDKTLFAGLSISLGFADGLQQGIETIVTSEIPSVCNIDYASVYKADFCRIMHETGR